jgi:hypothetical protein
LAAFFFLSASALAGVFFDLVGMGGGVTGTAQDKSATRMRSQGSWCCNLQGRSWGELGTCSGRRMRPHRVRISLGCPHHSRKLQAAHPDLWIKPTEGNN